MTFSEFVDTCLKWLGLQRRRPRPPSSPGPFPRMPPTPPTPPPDLPLPPSRWPIERGDVPRDGDPGPSTLAVPAAPPVPARPEVVAPRPLPVGATLPNPGRIMWDDLSVESVQALSRRMLQERYGGRMATPPGPPPHTFRRRVPDVDDRPPRPPLRRCSTGFLRQARRAPTLDRPMSVAEYIDLLASDETLYQGIYRRGTPQLGDNDTDSDIDIDMMDEEAMAGRTRS